jgi:type I restriction enzyme, S subunit
VKNNKTPEVRFAGFSEDWEWNPLGSISNKVTEKNNDNLYKEPLTNSAKYGIINQRDFFDKDISNDKNLNVYYIVQPDDFVYNPRISNLAPVDPIKKNNLGRIVIISPLYHVFRVHGIDKTYLEKYFSSRVW